MLNYTALLYHCIGSRIRQLRIAHGYVQADIETINTTTLSNIERGKTSRRNPHYINAVQIDDLCNLFDTSPSELIWGREEERAEFVKLVILALLINDSIDVFEPESISNWIESYWIYDPKMQEELKENLADTEEKYGYFINNKNCQLYALLNANYDSNYERVSVLMLKQLTQDYDFSRRFFSHLTNYTTNYTSYESDASDRATAMIKGYILNRGSYGWLMLDKQGIDYPRFILAFNRFWDSYGNQYIRFFEENLFIGDEMLLEKGLSGINNVYFHNAVTSQSFVELNESMALLAGYTDREAILSDLNMRLCMIQSIATHQHGDTEIAKCVSPIERMLQMQAEIYLSADGE